MSEKPGDFFLGAIDFFGILVPGISLLVLQGPALASVAGISLPEGQNWWDWVPTLVAAYVAGHFLLGLGEPLNRLARIVRPENRDIYFQVVRHKVPLPTNAARDRSNVFNAAFSYIRIVSPSALAEVERQAAEYKLFRSLTVLFIVDGMLTTALGHQSWGRVAVDVVLTLGAGTRYLFLLVWAQRLAFEFFNLLTHESGTAGTKAVSSG